MSESALSPSRGLSLGATVGLGIGIAVFVIGLAAGCWFLVRWRRRRTWEKAHSQALGKNNGDVETAAGDRLGMAEGERVLGDEDRRAGLGGEKDVGSESSSSSSSSVGNGKAETQRNLGVRAGVKDQKVHSMVDMMYLVDAVEIGDGAPKTKFDSAAELSAEPSDSSPTKGQDEEMRKIITAEYRRWQQQFLEIASQRSIVQDLEALSVSMNLSTRDRNIGRVERGDELFIPEIQRKITDKELYLAEVEAVVSDRRTGSRAQALAI